MFELEESIDLTSVEEAAVNRLGMQRPSKNQTVYVNIKQDDVCELTANEVEGMGKMCIRDRVKWDGENNTIVVWKGASRG